MSLPKRLYDLYREIRQCQVVSSGEVNTDSLLAFQNLVNAAQPVKDNVEEQAYRQLTKAMYHSNPVGFMQYISTSKNRVGALVLWTESKRIVQYFGLRNRVHLSWDPVQSQYLAVPHVQQPGARDDSTGDTTTSTNDESKTTTQRYARGNTRGTSRGTGRGQSRKSLMTARVSSDPATASVAVASAAWGDMTN
jgi:hypothetical protein